ncbi:MAG: hypothetical protein GX256_04730 [Fretibacterium sp.]|nr:hypothetical protein [Fretibacterium sp.]
MTGSKILMFALLLGALWRLDEYTACFALRGYTVKASDPVLERRLWEVFPSKSLRFWPSFLKQSQELKVFLERKLPVLVQTEMRTLGRFVTFLNWLNPWLRVEWRGQLWCVSREGRMWDAEDPDMRVPEGGAHEGPLWRLAIMTEEQGQLPGGVFPSPFPLDKIDDFLSDYQPHAWFEGVQEISWERRGGEDLFRLKLLRGSQVFEILIQKDKYKGQELGGMLDDILVRLSKEGGSHVVDATYEGKIILKELSTGAQEGSLK